MKSLLSYSDYRQFLIDLSERRKVQGQTHAELAREIGCQAAYFSQVLRGKVDLTEEHLHKLSLFLDLNEIETEFLLILIREAKAGSVDLKRHLAKQREKLLRSAEELGPRLKIKSVRSLPTDFNIYYVSTWMPSVIHVATSCPEMQTVDAISKRFQIEAEVVLFHLQRLERHGLVRYSDERWLFDGSSTHFSKNSPLDIQLQTARRLHAINKFSFRKEGNVHYSVVFGTDAGTMDKLKARLLDLIEEIHREIEPSQSEEVCALCLDLFRV
jgi:uncharacterized protein (TIGR02147 family)